MTTMPQRRPRVSNRLAYTALTLGSLASVVLGVALLLSPAAALVLGGLAGGFFGMVGLAMEVRR